MSGPIQHFIPFTLPVSGITGRLLLGGYVGDYLGCHTVSLAGFNCTMYQDVQLSRRGAEAVAAEFGLKISAPQFAMYKSRHWGCLWDFKNAAMIEFFEPIFFEGAFKQFCTQGKTIIMSDRIARLSNGAPFSMIKFAEYMIKIKKIPCIAPPCKLNPNYLASFNPTMVQTFVFLMPSIYGNGQLAETAWDTGIVANLPHHPPRMQNVVEFLKTREKEFSGTCHNLSEGAIQELQGQHKKHFEEYYYDFS